MITQLRSFAQRINMDKAVIYGLLSKVWVFIAGPVSVIFVATKFSPALQGYYYTFSTILALQVFVELGLGTVTQQFASHEWAKLELDKDGKIIGDKEALSRLGSIARISVKWFLIASSIAVIGLLVGGYFFFSTSSDYSISWLVPWIALCIFTGLNILLVPFWSLLEGCNQVRALYGFRLLLGVVMNVSVWIAIFTGTGLWAASIGSFFGILLAVGFIRLRYFRFFSQLLLTVPVGPQLNWKMDMFPMQWRIAVSWISGYFSFSLFTPILFKYQGPEIAGKFGMTWNIIGTLAGIANAWLAPQVPKFAMLVAQRNYSELDKLFWKLLKVIFFITLLLSLIAWSFIYVLPFLNLSIATQLSTRLLSPWPVAILLGAQILMVTSTPFSYYMRAHKEEPLMLLSVVAGILIAASTFFFGKNYSVVEVTLGYLAVNIIIIPMIVIVWSQFRKEKMLY